MLLVSLGVVSLLMVLGFALWPWVRGWLPQSQLIEAWASYFVVDLRIGQWGPIATLLLVAVIELVWALNLGRKSDSFERQWERLDRLHLKEVEVLNQEIELLKGEGRSIRAELELCEDLVWEDRTRLLGQLWDLQRMVARPSRSSDYGQRGVGPPILHSAEVAPDAMQLSPDVRGEWRQIIAQLERIEMITSMAARRGQSAVEAQQHADELLHLAGACYQLGQYERALGHYNRAIELVPSEGRALVSRAVVNYELGRYQAALRDLEHALKVEENPWAYLYRGLTQERLSERRRALEAYSRAIRLDADFVEAYYQRGLLYASMNEPDRALQDQSRVLELDPEHARAYAARGIARAELGEIQWALNDLDRGCQLAPQLPEVFYNRGLVRAEVEMMEEALSDLHRALELDPSFVAAYMTLGDVYFAVGEHWRAIDNYDRVLELHPQDVMAYDARGQARAAVREFEGAIADYSKALELDAGRPETLANRGAAYEKLGEFEQAILDLDRAVALDPGLAIAYYVRGLAYGSKGEYDKASRDLDRAVELDPSLNNKKRGLAGTTSV